MPLAVAAWCIASTSSTTSAKGVALAAISGAFTSGLGYVVWYAALRGLLSTQAAIVQLAVPVLAALGGIIFLGESLTAQFAVSAFTILAGVALAQGRRIARKP